MAFILSMGPGTLILCMGMLIFGVAVAILTGIQRDWLPFAMSAVGVLVLVVVLALATLLGP
jgi:hypothetical protein